MNGIIGMLTLAHGQLRGHSAENYIIKAEQLSKYLLSVINDILDMSRIEAGKIELESKPFELAALAEKLRNMFQKNVEAKGVAFYVEMKDVDVKYIVGDELRIFPDPGKLFIQCPEVLQKKERSVLHSASFRKKMAK